MRLNTFRRCPRIAHGGLMALGAILALPSPALALQAHAYQGLHIHQLAHVFFTFSMIVFALLIHRRGFAERKPWRLMAAGAWLLALWNIWAFGGHFLERAVPESSLIFMPDAQVTQLLLASWKERAYFIVKMDHLLAVPAIFCFYFGLRGILRAGDGKGSRPAEGGR